MSAELDDNKYNTDLATRQVEINEWTYNNKMDTLFVFQLVFLALLAVSVLFGLKRYGLLGGAFAWYATAIIFILCTVLIVNRAYYTRMLRDQRYWNERRFPGDGVKGGALSQGSTDMKDYIDEIRTKYPESGKTNPPGCKCP